MDSKKNIELLEEFLKTSKYYYENKDFDNALKYAALASVSTDYPRADVCCCMGDIYMARNNMQWARFWFEKAIGSIYIGIDGEKIDESFSSWLPMLRLSYITYMLNDIDTAYEYNEAVLKLCPDNGDAIVNKKSFEEMMKNKNE